ncbi:MAG: DMT family transporter [Xanthobacteraceae bacterium]|nr:DMT family transporter [Xanthobacteraceae bacterium]
MAARPLDKRIKELIAAALGSSAKRYSGTGLTNIPTGPLGVICGTAAALFWAAGLAVARQGIDAGLAPVDLVFHRCIWAGLAFLPVVIANRAADLRIFGWGRGVVLTLCGGPILSAFSYSGFLGAPLGHGGVIQPSCAALGGLALATLVLKEPPLATRLVGAIVIVAGLAVIGFEALTNIGTHALLGDISFATAGFLFAVFGMLLKLWRIAPTRAVIVTGVLSLVLIPVQWLIFGFERMIAAGFLENLLQVVFQGFLSGAASIFLFTRAVILLGAARAAVFPTLVPPFTLLIGYLVLGVVPTLFQLCGLVLVLTGFHLTQRA